MEGIIDIHNHIVFGVDDGAEDLSQSMDIIRSEYEQGVRKIIMTPHYKGGRFEKDEDEIEQKFKQIEQCVNKEYSDMKLYRGREVMYTGGIDTLIKENKISSLAGSKYVLIEFLPDVEYKVMEKSIKEVLLGGYIPVVAHCERYECLRTKISRVAHLVETGAYMQVNAESVYSFRNKKFIKKLIDEDCLHFVATDAHNNSGRGVHFNKCERYLTKKYKREYVEWLLIENPQKIIDDRYI